MRDKSLGDTPRPVCLSQQAKPKAAEPRARHAGQGRNGQGAGRERGGHGCGHTMEVMTVPTVSLPWKVAPARTAPSAAAAPSPVDVACARVARERASYLLNARDALSLGPECRESEARERCGGLTRLCGEERAVEGAPAAAARGRTQGFGIRPAAAPAAATAAPI